MNKTVRVKNVIAKLEKKYGTQKKVAEAIGMTETWYNRIRNGHHVPPEKTLMLMELVAK